MMREPGEGFGPRMAHISGRLWKLASVEFQEGSGQEEMPVNGKNTSSLHCVPRRWAGKEKELSIGCIPCTWCLSCIVYLRLFRAIPTLHSYLSIKNTQNTVSLHPTGRLPSVMKEIQFCHGILDLSHLLQLLLFNFLVRQPSMYPLQYDSECHMLPTS